MSGGGTWAWPVNHTLRQRLRTSEAIRQKSGSAAPRPALVNMAPIAPLRFTCCQWICVAEPPWPRCGAPTQDGCAWCTEHRRIVFEPREVQRMP